MSITLRVGTSRLTCDVAVSPNDQAEGLQKYSSLESDHGLLFVFDPPRSATFHTGSVSFPFDIVALNEGGTVARIIENVQPGSKSLYPLPKCAAVLETKGGWCAENGLRVGDEVREDKTAQIAGGPPQWNFDEGAVKTQADQYAQGREYTLEQVPLSNLRYVNFNAKDMGRRTRDPRGGPKYVERMIEAFEKGEKIPPVLGYRDPTLGPKGKVVIWDGNHRVSAWSLAWKRHRRENGGVTPPVPVVVLQTEETEKTANTFTPSLSCIECGEDVQECGEGVFEHVDRDLDLDHVGIPEERVDEGGGLQSYGEPAHREITRVLKRPQLKIIKKRSQIDLYQEPRERIQDVYFTDLDQREPGSHETGLENRWDGNDIPQESFSGTADMLNGISSDSYRDETGYSPVMADPPEQMVRSSQIVDPTNFIAGIVEGLAREALKGNALDWREDILNGSATSHAVIDERMIHKWLESLHIEDMPKVREAAMSSEGLNLIGDGMVLAGVADIARVKNDKIILFRQNKK